MVTDYDCWHPDHDHVTVEAVIKVLLDNASKGRTLVKSAMRHLEHRQGLCDRGCHRALDHAIITAPDARDPAIIRKLDAVAGRVLRR
jgi:5'-methylthioadenosine phosphorylase